ncbi:unnamed protein product, partial [Aureobasidium uvarum]
TPQTLRHFSLSCHRNQTSSSDGNDTPMSFWRKLKEYPELFEMLKASRHRSTKEFYARIRAEPELLRMRQEEHSRVTKLLYSNSEYRASHKRKAIAWNHAHKHDEHLIITRAIHAWFFRYPRTRPESCSWAGDHQLMPWKTHRPISYHAKTACYCTSCGIERQLKGMTQTCFLCNTHYAERGWSEAMPKGYEDIRTFGNLRARYDKLNGSMASQSAYNTIRQRQSETS